MQKTIVILAISMQRVYIHSLDQEIRRQLCWVLVMHTMYKMELKLKCISPVTDKSLGY